MPRQSEGTCVPKTTCTTSDQLCPEGTRCRIMPRQSSGVCAPFTSTQTQTQSPTTQPTTQTTQTATQNTAQGQGTLVNPLRAQNIQQLLGIILGGLVQIGTIILVLMLVWVGFLFVFAQGSEEKVREARAALMWTVIGGLVLLGARAIATLLEATVNAL